MQDIQTREFFPAALAPAATRRSERPPSADTRITIVMRSFFMCDDSVVFLFFIRLHYFSKVTSMGWTDKVEKKK
jgi:hypothetical protein